MKSDILNTNINQMLTDLNQVKTTTELIGDDWVVVADDVRQFEAFVPEIAAAAEHATNGTLKLNQEQVAAVLNGNLKILNSNKEVIVSSIDNKIIQLKVENDFQKNKIKILKDVLKGEKTEAEAEFEIRKAAENYKEDLIEASVKIDSQAWDAAMANAEVGANNIINQLKSIDDAIAIVHDSYGKMFITDKLSDFNVIGVSAGMTGNTDWTSNISVEDYSKKLSQETIDAITARNDNAQAIEEANNMEIASLEGARAEILKTLKDSSDAIDRVNSGKAGKEDKSLDKSKKDKDEKGSDDEFDRHWAIKKAIDAVDKALNKLAKDKENLYGYELIDALHEENRLLE